MRICFDRLCFANKRPAPTDNRAAAETNDPATRNRGTYHHNSDNVNKIIQQPTPSIANQQSNNSPALATPPATNSPTQPPTSASSLATSTTCSNHRSVGSLRPTDGASRNALDPPLPTSTTNNKHTDEEKAASEQNHKDSLLGNIKSPTSTLKENILDKQSAGISSKESKQTPDVAAEAAVAAAAAGTETDRTNQSPLSSNKNSNKTQAAREESTKAQVENTHEAKLRHTDNTKGEDHNQQHSEIVVKASREIIEEQNESTKADKMQQEANANIQFQPDLGLVNNNNLPALGGTLYNDTATGTLRLSLPIHPADVLTHTLIYGTVPTEAQQLNTDPNLQTRNILHQQELQLQQRYQQLQQLQQQTQGIFATSPATVTPIVIQPTANAAGAQSLYASNNQAVNDYCAHQQKLLAAQMQGLCLNANTPSPTNSTGPGVGIGDPTAGGVSLLSSSYVPATQQEERFIQIIQAKDLKIQEMQRAIQYKDTEIAELKSHLDKFQSVFPFSRSGATTPSGGVSSSGAVAGAVGGASVGAVGGIRKSGQSFQRQRAQGISAEPQSESSVLLDNVTFPKYDKDEK